MDELKAGNAAGDGPGEERRRICRALTSVLRQSPLAEALDPKSFFMMLNSNFDMLYISGALDLEPVWQAIAGGRPPHLMYGLFLRFEEIAAVRGFRVRAPDSVRTLTQDQRAEYLGLAQTLGEAPLEVVGSDDLEDDDVYTTDPNAVAIPLALGTGDLKPFIPEELRRQVVGAVVQSLKVAPVGQMLDSAQLAFLVDSNFDDLCDGHTFDFAPIHSGLLQLDGVKDSDILVGLVRLEQALGELNLSLQPINLDVEPELAQRLLTEHEEKERAAAAAAALEAAARARNPDLVRRTGDLHRNTAVPLAPTTPEPARGDARERRLRKWGLTRISSTRTKAIRYSVLTAVLLAVLAFGWSMRPDRPLDETVYAGTLPIKKAELLDGAFQAVVDDSKWWPLSKEEREQRLAAFEKVLREQGHMLNAQIRDGEGRLVITAVGARKLKVARYFQLGDKDGNIPEDDPKPPAEPPPPAKDPAPPEPEQGTKPVD
ncbi:MAG: hypothetical protein KC933_03870 [Myxococcales bacterium]|nr:hypothetical protein [Myxococcales bacterium]